MTLGLEPIDRREEIRIRKQGRLEQRERIVVDAVAARRQALYRASQLIWLVSGVLEALIGLRIMLKLIAANPDAGFARFIYAVTAPLLQPFMGLTLDPAYQGMVLEVSSLIAMVVYAIGTWAVVQAIWLLFHRIHTSSLSTYRRVD